MQEIEESIMQSKLSQSYFSKESWLVSASNKGALLTGHSVLFVEGLRDDGTLFFGKYDIRATLYSESENSVNEQGYIHKIVAIDADLTCNYSNYQARSWPAEPKLVEEMISAIKADEKEAKRLNELIENKLDNDEAVFINRDFIRNNGFQSLEYQTVGKSSFFSEKNAGTNCTNWVVEKLKIANINPTEIFAAKKPNILAGGTCCII